MQRMGGAATEASLGESFGSRSELGPLKAPCGVAQSDVLANAMLDARWIALPTTLRVRWLSCTSRAASRLRHAHGRSHGRGLAKGRSVCVERALCLHAAPAAASAHSAPGSQVEVNEARPALCDEEAALRTAVVNEVSPHAARTSVPHAAQLLQRGASRQCLPGSSSPRKPMSRLMSAAFVRRTRAVSAFVTTTIASEVAGDVAAALSARIDDSKLVRRCWSQPWVEVEAAGAAQAAHGGRRRAAAWRPRPGGSGCRCRRAEDDASSFFRMKCRWAMLSVANVEKGLCRALWLAVCVLRARMCFPKPLRTRGYAARVLSGPWGPHL